MYALIGLIVTLAAFAITETVIGALDGRAPSGTAVDSRDTMTGPDDTTTDPDDIFDDPDDTSTGSDDIATDPGSGKDEVVEIKSITVSGLSVMKEGTEYGFSTKIVPDYATNKTITWSSSAPKVASVSKNGRVKAIKAGETVISATARNGVVGKKTVTVVGPVVAKSVEITSTITVVQTGKTIQLKADISPSNTEDKTLNWSSSNKKIATVSKEGKVKGISAGKVTITVETKNKKKDKVTIKVQDSADVVMAAKVKDLQNIVKKYAKKKYSKNDKNDKQAYLDAYKNSKYKSVCNSRDCGVFVYMVMHNSGWEPKYPATHTGGQYKWLKNSKNGWEEVTKKIHSNNDAKPGDIIITRGRGHVLLYMGKIDGFESPMASASYCNHTAMSDGRGNNKVTNITYYKNHKHNGTSYAIFRKKSK